MTLAEWEERWTLNGDHLHCNNCKVAQWPFNAGQAFLHELDCAYQIGEPDYPWRDLARIARTELRNS
jgi:hypothetical protein